MIVVSDTTPLRYLAVIGQIDLLPQVCDAIVEAAWRAAQPRP